MARAAIYAMIQLGCRKIFVYNRTVSLFKCASLNYLKTNGSQVENAYDVAAHFNSWASGLTSNGEELVHVLRSPNEEWPQDCKQPTMIVSCVPARSVGGVQPANFEMPLHWLNSPTGGVVAEVRTQVLILNWGNQC